MLTVNVCVKLQSYNHKETRAYSSGLPLSSSLNRTPQGDIRVLEGSAHQSIAGDSCRNGMLSEPIMRLDI